MQIEEFTSTLEERGFWWQAIGFGMIGAVSVTVLSIYSDSHDTMIEVYRLAATQVQWAFVAPIVATVERIRKMFEKKSEIRRMAREEAIAKAKERGRQEAMEQFRSDLHKRGIRLSREDEEAIFNRNGHNAS